jgi:hypothetical protein
MANAKTFKQSRLLIINHVFIPKSFAFDELPYFFIEPYSLNFFIAFGLLLD